MFDSLKVLDQFLGAGTADKMNELTGGKFGQVVTSATQTIGDVATQSVGGLTDLAAQARGYLPGANDPNAPDIGALATQAKDFVEKNVGTMGAGVIAGSLATVLLGTQTGRALTGDAAKLGGLALIGGLAYRAYQNWQAGQAPAATPADVPAPAAAPQGSPFSGNHSPDAQARAQGILEAMIAAAKADGEIDAAERQRIVGRAGAIGIDPAAHAYLDAEMAKPLNIDGLVAGAATQEGKIELYAASAVVIDPGKPANGAYLDTLAEKLGLDPALRQHLDAEAAGARAL